MRLLYVYGSISGEDRHVRECRGVDLTLEMDCAALQGQARIKMFNEGAETACGTGLPSLWTSGSMATAALLP